MATRIPKSQAAYQRGRGTTEQALALKLLIDKAITSSDYDVFILLLDMSKAFDTVNRKVLLQELNKEPRIPMPCMKNRGCHQKFHVWCILHV